MSELERAIRRLRADLLNRDARAGSEMLSAYGEIRGRITDSLNLLLQQMEEAQGRGETVSQAWLMRENRLQALQQQARTEMNRFAEFAEAEVVAAQRQAVEQSQMDAQTLTLAGLEDVGRIVAVTGAWNRLPTETVAGMVGMLQDGSPLRTLFDNFGVQASEGMRQALIAGVAMGKNPRAIGRDLRDVLDIGHTRAQTIARTETLRAYRSASIKTYEENSDVVSAWRWFASLSARTCALCLAMHGKTFPFTKAFGSHPNCRCVAIPVLDGAPEVETGEAWFARQSEATQERVLGQRAAQAYRAGEVTLPDFVGVAQSERWGETRHVVSLEEAKFAARLRAPSPPAPPAKPFPEILREREDTIRNQRFETAIAWDADGKEVLVKDGQQYSVDFTEQEAAKLKGTVFTHNHPRGLDYPANDPRAMGNSFSIEDIFFASKWEIGEIRAVTPKQRFSMKPPDGGWNKDYLANTLRPSVLAHHANIRVEYLERIARGIMTPEEAEARHYHELWTRVSSELGLHYTREEN